MEEFALRLAQRLAFLPQGLQAHINRVRDIAVELAPCHNVDPQQAGLGALAHDVARAMSDRELLEQSSRLSLPVGVVEQHVPLLLHGPVGAELLRTEDNLGDESILQAVWWHSTCHPNLDTLGKIVFLADKLDPQKLPRYPYQPELRRLAEQDLDKAVLEFLTREMISLTDKGQMVHPVMLDARNHLLASTSQPDASNQNM